MKRETEVARRKFSLSEPSSCGSDYKLTKTHGKGKEREEMEKKDVLLIKDSSYNSPSSGLPKREPVKDRLTVSRTKPLPMRCYLARNKGLSHSTLLPLSNSFFYKVRSMGGLHGKESL